MAYVNALATVLPDHVLTQDQVREMGRRILKGKVPFLDTALALFTNAGVEQRRTTRPAEELLANDRLGWRNGLFIEESIRLGTQLVSQLLEQAKLKPEDIDLILTTSCTGFMIPSLDAYLINHFRMRQDIKRLPVTELGCAAGAMAFSRALDYLRAYPDHKVMLLAIELPSLTYRTKDFRPANLVSVALFGDGGAGAILSTEPGPCRLLASTTHFYYDSPEMMGFDLSEKGFQIILDKRISDLVLNHFADPLKNFLNQQGLSLDQLRHFVFHPGGRKIMDSLVEALALDESAISASREVLREVGNLSSASVFWVLERVLRGRPEGLGIMAAFGPGFNAELLTLDFDPGKGDSRTPA